MSLMVHGDGFSSAAHFHSNLMLSLYLYLLLPAGGICYLIMAEIIQKWMRLTAVLATD